MPTEPSIVDVSTVNNPQSQRFVVDEGLSRIDAFEMKKMATGTSYLTGLGNRPLRLQIADALQGAILAGELRPGEPLVEMDIASKLGVSRGPVREALQILETWNLIESVPYHGTKVRSLTKTDIEELYSLRSVLETFAVRRIIASGPDVVIEELREACDAMQATAAEMDWHALAAMDDQFHRTLIHRANHSLLTQAWEQLDVRVRQIMALRNLRNEDIMQIYRNHVPILDAIAARDEATAVSLLETHIASAADLMVDDMMGDAIREPSDGVRQETSE